MKNVSSRRMQSGWMDATSSSTGMGGPLNVYDISVGCIMMSEFQHRLPSHHQPVERGLVRGVVRRLQKLRPAEVEHELGVDGERAGHAERLRRVLGVLPELGPHADQRPVQPPEQVERLLVLGPKRRHPRDEKRRRLLVESGHDVVRDDVSAQRRATVMTLSRDLPVASLVPDAELQVERGAGAAGWSAGSRSRNTPPPRCSS